MRRIYGLLILILILGSGCSKKGKTTSYNPRDEYSSYNQQQGNRPSFVTGDEQVSQKPNRQTKPDRSSNKSENITPIRFPEKETEHVRIVNYDPFNGRNDMIINLDELRRDFCYPYSGNLISDYGMRGRSMHTGIDIKALPSDTVRAALSGVVRMSKEYSSYGNIVVIRHECGLETVYAHNSRNLVRPNQIVFAGDPIALAGRTGRATTEHIHFEVRVMGEHFDPNLLVDPQKKCINSGYINLNQQNGRILASGSGVRKEQYTQPKEEEPVWVAENTNTETNTRPTVSTVVARPIMAEQQQTAASSTASTESAATTSQKAGSVSSSSSSSYNQQQKEATQNQHSATPEYYTIQRGDTLYSLSRRFGLTVNELCRMNGITNEDAIQAGQRIRVK